MTYRRVYLAVLIAFLLLFPLSAGTTAGDHHGRGNDLRKSFSTYGEGSKSRGRDHGHETTGLIAIWSLAAANLTVLASLLIKGANRHLPVGEETKKRLGEINRGQKKYLSKVHYFLNPLILGVALLHWSLSRCASTSLPEMGLVLMLLMGGMGLILKFRLAPQSFTKVLYKIHTHPAAIGSAGLILLTGHLIVD